MLRIKKIHFIGIAGVGMSGIAEVLANLNYQVSGSDPAATPNNTTIQRLQKLGIKVSSQHAANNVTNADVVVVSSAVSADNIEVITAKELKIPVIPRAEMLAELMRLQQGIAIAGTHGKTTTTSLIASLLADAGLDPTFVIGGQLNSLNKNANLGQGKYFVAEADESDASFLHLTPIIAVITNIDSDHLGTYEHSMEKLRAAFVEFTNRLPFYGLLVACIDDSGVRDIYSKICKPVITYGFSADADIQAVEWQQSGGVSTFKVKIKPSTYKYIDGQQLGPNLYQSIAITLNLPGKHNVLNALASIAVALEVGVDIKAIIATLNNFQGIGRRFQVLGNYKMRELAVSDVTASDAGASVTPITLIDDYGHHPNEVLAVINAIRAGWPQRRLVMVYQPHRYSRTKDLFDEFVTVLAQVDVLLMLDIYSAGEAPIDGISTKAICDKITLNHGINAIHVVEKDKISEALITVLEAGDMLLMQGAGDIGKLAKDVAEKFAVHFA
jgi:UDP-N-acetylmuramate--alanine ligase